jgi:hypothetical protein
MKRLFTITAPDKSQCQIYAESLEEARVRYLDRCSFKMEALTPVDVYDKLWNFMHTHEPGHTYRKECIDLIEQFGNEQRPTPVPQKTQAPGACNNEQELTPKDMVMMFEIEDISSPIARENLIKRIEKYASQEKAKCKHPSHTMWKLLYEAYEHLKHMQYAGSHLDWLIKYRAMHADCIESIIDKQNYPL